MRQDKGKDLPDWADWCFLPIAGFMAIADQAGDRLEYARLAACETWRYTKGIYKFDADFGKAIAETKPAKAMPCDVLLRLPQWCCWVECPGVPSFFVHLEHDMNTKRAELRFLLDVQGMQLTLTLHLGDWDVMTGVEKWHQEAQRVAKSMNRFHATSADTLRNIAETIEPLLSLTLYLCSDEPELSTRDEPEFWPRNAQPKKVKGGFKLFAADKPTVIDVGKESGEKLRSSQRSEQGSGSKAPHIRRAHWHGFWSGPKGAKVFNYKWLPPTFVGNKDELKTGAEDE